MVKKITISFKNNEKDNELYDLLDQLDDRSYILKRILRKIFMEEETKNYEKY